MNLLSKTFVIFLTLLFLSCDRHKVEPIICNDYPTAYEEEATLKWTGEVAADGCGFYIIIDGVKYKAENESAIDASYKTDAETQVMVSYTKLNHKIEYACGLTGPVQIDGIRIISIKKK